MTIDITVPVVNRGLLYINGLQLAVASTTTLTMAAGACRNSSNANDIVLAQAVTIDTSVNGINGLDTGVLAIDSLYAVYAAGDSYKYNTGGAVLSLNLDSPGAVEGYDMFQLIGYQFTDGSAHFVNGIWFGAGQVREWQYATGVSVLNGGTSATYASVDLSGAVPVPSIKVGFNADFDANVAGDTFALTPTGVTSTNGIVIASSSVTTAEQQFPPFDMIVGIDTDVASIDYKVAASGNLDLTVARYVISL